MAEYGEEQNNKNEEIIKPNSNSTKDTLETNWEPTSETVDTKEIEPIWEPTKEEEDEGILSDDFEPTSEKIKKISKINYKNLKDLKKWFLEYQEQTKNKPNRGGKVSTDFEEWINKNIKDLIKKEDILHKYDEINKNDEITNYIIFKSLKSGISQREIIRKLKEIGTPISRGTGKRIALKKAFLNDVNKYNERFSQNKEAYKISLKNQEISKNDYKNLENLQSWFKEYRNQTKMEGIEKYPNKGKKISSDFLKWIDNYISSTGKTITQELITLIKKKSELINKNEEIRKFALYQIRNTKLSQKHISRKLERMGIHINPELIKRIASNDVFPNDSEGLDKRFPHYKIIIERNFKLKELEYNNLMNAEIQRKFKDYIQFTLHQGKKKYPTPYPNRGQSLTLQFKEWIKSTENNHDMKENLLNICEKIEDNQEITQFIADKVLNTNWSANKISKETNKIGIYVSNKLVCNIALNNVFKGVEEKCDKRFPTSTDLIPKEIRREIKETIDKETKKIYPASLREIGRKFKIKHETIRKIAINQLTEDIVSNIWISNKDKIPQKIKNAIIKEVKNAYPESMNKIGTIYGVSESTVSRIAKEENSKEEYERKWPTHGEIPDDTRNSVLNDIKKTKLDQTQIADKYKITRHSVRRFAMDHVFPNDKKGLKDRFPRDDFLELGTQTHKCLLDEITQFFNIHHKEKFIAEPRIYPGSHKGGDGLILNDQGFLQRHLKNTHNFEDLSQIIYNIPADKIKNQFNHIKAIQFDFTNDITDVNILSKIEKYQDPHIMFFIVGTKWYPYDHVKPLTNDKVILYPENVKIISHDLFSDLINLKGTAKEHFKKIIELNDESNIHSLRKIHEQNNTEWNHTAQLREELIQKGFIKRSINEYFKIQHKSNLKQKRLF